MAFELPKLPYAYDALEPHIDARTMEIHHSKHHNAYVTNLNAAIAGTDMEGKTIENILINLDMTNMAVRNNGGGHYNHNLFSIVLAQPIAQVIPSIVKLAVCILAKSASETISFLVSSTAISKRRYAQDNGNFGMETIKKTP